MGQHRAHRGSRRATSAPRATVTTDASACTTAYSEGGKRRAESSPVIAGLPSAPVLAGVAALAISATGAATATTTGLVTASATQASDPAPTPAADQPATTTSRSVSKASVASLIANRRAVVSRDHSRTSETTTEDLQAAASEQVAGRTAALEQASDAAAAQSQKIEANQWVLPTSGYRLTARFHQSGRYWSSGFHTGLDFANSTGTPLVAVANGTITSAGYDGSYGNKTVLTLDDGTEIWYCHQSALNVSVGDKVNGGDVIGLLGSTGNVTGPHLHLEVFDPNGNAQDPYTALVAHGVQP